MASTGTKRPLEEQPPSKANAIAPPAAKKGRKPAEIKLQPIKKSLNDRVKTLAKMVDLDWHDGWLEQEEELGEYLSSLNAHFQSVYDIGVVQNTAHGDCHKVLLTIADTWENMKTIPMRGTIEGVVRYSDYNVNLFDESKPDDDEGELVITEVDAHMKAGLERLKQWHAQSDKWKRLPTHKKVHKERPMIDRRYDGPKHLRTRDFSDSDYDF